MSELSTKVVQKNDMPVNRSLIEAANSLNNANVPLYVEKRKKLFPRTSDEMDMFIKKYNFERLLLPINPKAPDIFSRKSKLKEQPEHQEENKSNNITELEESSVSLHYNKRNLMSDPSYDEVKQYLELEFTRNLDRIPSLIPSAACSYTAENESYKDSVFSRENIESELAQKSHSETAPTTPAVEVAPRLSRDASKISSLSLTSVSEMTLQQQGMFFYFNRVRKHVIRAIKKFIFILANTPERSKILMFTKYGMSHQGTA